MPLPIEMLVADPAAPPVTVAAPLDRISELVPPELYMRLPRPAQTVLPPVLSTTALPVMSVPFRTRVALPPV